MIINITKSQIFCKDPDTRFSNEYALPLGVWNEVWRRYKLLDYTNTDIRDYLFIKYARNLSYDSIDRWIVRNKIYSITFPLVKKGIEYVNTEIFGELEGYVINELVKSLKTGATNDSKIIL